MMWYKIIIKKKLYRKVKKFWIVVKFFIWIVIKNYWCNIKSKKSKNVLMIGIKKYEKVKKVIHE